jgi:hypothetical protein
MTRRTSLRPADPTPPADTAKPADTVSGVDTSPVSVEIPNASRSWDAVSLLRGVPPAALMAGSVAGGILLVTVAVALRSTAASNPSVQPAVSAPTMEIDTPAPPPVVAPTTTCPSIASWLDVIATYERQARWSLAASSAQTALRTAGLCEEDRLALGQKMVALSKEALFEQPPAPEDAPGQRRVAAAYVDLKALAEQNGMPPPPPLQVARSAYDSRLFLLASAAYAEAFTSGEATVEDREVVRAAYATQRNIGLIWSQRADPRQRQEGLARLVTACRIHERELLGSPEACDDLKTLLGPREKWPAPSPDPLIDTLRPPTQGRGL